MEFFRIKKDIPFMKHALIFNVISAITFVAAVFFLWKNNLHYSIEFTGGTVMEVAYKKAANTDRIRKTVEGLGFGDTQVQSFGAAENVMIRLPVKPGVDNAKISQSVFAGLCQAESGTVEQAETTIEKSEKKSVCRDAAKNESISLRSVEFVGPQVGDELARDGLTALLMVVVGVMLYLALRFEWKFAVAAIVANLHDVVIILGFFAFFQWEFSLSVLAGVLAVLGYSVNESVVIFDRIRENVRKFPSKSLGTIIDYSVLSTMARSINTSSTLIFVLVATLLFGGSTVFYFVLALLIGVIAGTYSSIFIASPILYLWQKR